MRLGIVVGLKAEARVARGLGGKQYAAGIAPGAAEAAAMRAVADGAQALLSFGLAGGLAPTLAAGCVVAPRAVLDEAGHRWPTDPALAGRLGGGGGALLASAEVLATAFAKRAAWRSTGAVAVDMESAAVAQVAWQHGLPFAVLRAICDPADLDLPPAALTALDDKGRMQPVALLRELGRNPWQIGALLRLGRHAARARAALVEQVKRIGPLA